MNFSGFFSLCEGIFAKFIAKILAIYSRGSCQWHDQTDEMNKRPADEKIYQ